MKKTYNRTEAQEIVAAIVSREWEGMDRRAGRITIVIEMCEGKAGRLRSNVEKNEA